ncbi:MAG: hypothetical protein JSU96_02710 [Acidobacteriota bacterium]|nr:MAG: hypothetical protein JSU96_02710 [Acidobacteriota bacterium]
MKKSISMTIVITLLLGSALLAQPKRGANRGAGYASDGVPIETTLIEGQIAQINLGIGQGSPSVVLEDGTTVMIAPYFVLEDLGLSFSEGDHFSAEAFPSRVYDGIFVAVSVNIGGETLFLRDEFGRPSWAAGRRGGVRGQRGTGQCGGMGPGITPQDITESTMVIEEVDMVPGRGFPTISAGGFTIVVGPYRAWTNAPFELQVQDEITIKTFPSPFAEDTLVAVQIVKNGQTLTLRDDSGIPIGGHGKGGYRSALGCQAIGGQGQRGPGGN